MSRYKVDIRTNCKVCSYAGLVLGLDFDFPWIQSGREFEMKLSTIGYARDLVEANSGLVGNNNYT